MIANSQEDNSPIRLDVIIGGLLDGLREYKHLGELKQWFVNAEDGSSSAVYQHGIIRYDKFGKQIRKEAA